MQKITSHPLLKALDNISKIPLIKQKTVQLLAVTKKTNADKVKELFDLGQRAFGENYVDEILEKSEKLTKEIEWYFIGHLQTNKVKKLLQIKNLSTISSVDSYKLAEEINKQCEKLNRTVRIFIQVNISNEESKSGCKIDDVVKLFSDISKNLKCVTPAGIMALGTIGCVEEFEKLYELKCNISKECNISLDDVHISNGTSNDYELAIKYGSTQVRLGTILIKNQEI